VQNPERYEHCDFESYVTDLTDGKPGCRSTRIAEAGKALHARVCARISGSSEKGLLFMGLGVGKTHLAVAR